jgi:hypothetical protein
MASSTQALLPWLPFLAVPTIVAAVHAVRRYNVQVNHERQSELKHYSGSCHCKGVTFRVAAQRSLTVWRCNCSICFMKKNWHFIVPVKNFVLQSGKELLTEYKFNTKTATHVFCKVCGVQAYYIPRSNPDGIAVTLACLPPEQVSFSFLKTSKLSLLFSLCFFRWKGLR